jgi:hypothetical protein
MCNGLHFDAMRAANTALCRPVLLRALSRDGVSLFDSVVTPTIAIWSLPLAEFAAIDVPPRHKPEITTIVVTFLTSFIAFFLRDSLLIEVT